MSCWGRTERAATREPLEVSLRWRGFCDFLPVRFLTFILAFLLALFVVGFGGADPAVVGTVEPGSAAYEAGLQEGDRILRLDDSRIYNFREISLYNFIAHGETGGGGHLRAGRRKHTVEVDRHLENGSYLFGVTMTDNTEVGPLGTLKYSLLEVRYQIKSTFLSLKYLVSGRASMNDMSGPVGIVNMIGDTYEQSIVYGIGAAALSLTSFAILLSANLGVMNLLPLPALDGGRLLFIIIEMIRRKR